MLNGDTGERIFHADFEDANVPAGEYRFFHTVSGLTATNKPVEVQNNHPAVGMASQGTKLLELDGTNGVFVDIANVPGRGLILQLDYSARRGFDPVQNEIEVLWNGSLIATLAADGRGQKGTDFQPFEFTLPGNQTSGRLVFRSTTVNDPFGAGGLLDDINVFKFKEEEKQPPVLQAINNRIMNQGETISIQLSATDPDSSQNQLRYSAIQTPVGSTLDPVTGVFRWTPNKAAAGFRFNLEVGVTDEAGLSDSKPFKITVKKVITNQSPVLLPIADRTITTGETISIQLAATDADSTQNQLRYSGVRIPVGSTLDPVTGLFTWTPNKAAGGLRFNIEVGVTDQTGLTNTKTFKISVNAVVENQAPRFQTIDEQTIDEGKTLTVQLFASDQDSNQNQLRYSATRAPVGSTLNPITGVFKWTPNRFAGGLKFGIDVVVTDETGLTDKKTFKINVNDLGDGLAPRFQPIADKTIDEGKTITVQLAATDQDSTQSQLRYSTTRSPVGSTLDPVTGLFTWTPNRFAGGLRFGIDVVVTDETGLTDSKTFRINVNDLGDGQAPILQPISDRTIRETETLSVQLVATDADSNQNQLRYMALRAPAGSALDPITGLFTWTPNRFAGGFRFGIDVRVTDETGMSDMKTFRVTVENLNAAPVLANIVDQTIAQTNQLVFIASATDADRPLETLTYSLTGTMPGGTNGAAIDPVTGRFTWTPTATTPIGTYGVNVVVIDEAGNQDSQAVNITVTAAIKDTIDLLEETRFETIAEQVIQIDENTNLLSFDYAPLFDLTDTDYINDAFEVALLDMQGNSLVHTTSTNRDSFFNATEEEAVALGVNTQLDGSTVKLDLSHIADGTTAKLVFRLVNNDDDTNTSVRITEIGTSDEMLLTPAGKSASPITPRLPGAINFANLSDVTGSLSIRYGQTSFNRTDDSLFTQIELTNVGQVAISGRMLAVFDNPTSEFVQLFRPEGRMPDGRYFVELTSESGVLGAGETTRSRDLVLSNPNSELFKFDLRILAEVNSAPSGFTSTPPTKIEAGRTIRYTATAIDPDVGQTLTYSIVTGHENIAINAITGELTWPTTSEEIGLHRVTIRATDPFGLSVEQAFSIDVLATLQNRPPNFVSDPVTDAIASSGFEVTTLATGDNPNGVGVISGFRGPRIVTINSDDQTVGVYEGSGNDRFDDETTYSTGEPPRTGNAIQAGYTVDVGLPAFINNTDQNDIFGLDQADFNNDGIVDLASLTYHYSNILRDGYFHDLVVNFGDGDGGFGEPVIVEQFFFTSKVPLENFTVADVNGDGESDLLWSRYQQFSSSYIFEIYAIIGNGDGTFQSPAVTNQGTPIGDFRVVDLDQDGNADLVGRRQFVDDIGWLKGVGDGTFEAFDSLSPEDTFTFVRNDRTRAFQVLDLDGDGDNDIVQGRRADKGIQVLTNDGNLNFTETAVLGAYPQGGSAFYQALQVADFTGDGFLDLFYTQYSDQHYYLIKGTADGFEAIRQEATALNPHVGVGNPAGDDRPVDIDGDGDLDLLIGISNSDGSANLNYGARIFLNDGDGFFTPVAYSAEIDPFGQPNQDAQRNVLFVAGVLSADYNRDGVADLVFYTSGSASFGVTGYHSVSIALGTRPGEFAASRTYPNYTRTDIAPVAADFNNDGLVDILSVGSGELRLGTGDGTFAEPFQATPGTPGDHTLLTDFNLDGNIDMLQAAGGRGSGSIAGFHLVQLGNGDGTFEISYLERDTDGGYEAASIADFNGDGYPDFITKGGFGAVEAFLNDPTNPGDFTRTYLIDLEATSGYGTAMDVGDFNEDGIIDFVTVERVDGLVRLQTYTGLRDGTFELVNEEFDFAEGLTTVFGTFGLSPNLNLHTADVNKDGHLDVVNFSAVGNFIHLGNGDGTFYKPSHGFIDQNSTTGGNVLTEVIDIDGDGNLDLVRALPGRGTLNINKGNGDGTFATPERYNFVGLAGRPYFADLDNDGHLDLVFKESVINGSSQTDIKAFFGARDGLVDVLTVDLNGDGNEEVLAINEDNDRLKIFVGDNLGGLTRQNDLLVGRAPRAVATADLDGDGTLELITANRAGRSISVLSGDLVSGYTVVDFDIDGAPIDVEVSDLDGDGNPDIVVLDEANNALWVFAGNGTTTLDAPLAVALGDAPSKFVLADANGDGDVDAVITLPESNRVMILGGDGAGGFSAPVYVSTESSPSDIAVFDLNDDGNPDLAITLPESNVLSVHYGLGGNQFARAQKITVGETPTRVTAADADDDGRVDLIVTNLGDNTASVIFNRFDPNEVYRYDANAIDPDDDDLNYRVADGPGGLFIDSSTGEVIWAASPDQVGQHSVTLEADDGRGGIATQQFVIDVQPPTENSAPLIATEPIATIGANDSFEYQVSSIDDDNDSLRYRIIDGPEGATIDPITGLLQWDGRTDSAVKLTPYGILARGNVVMLADPSLQPENITVEGWYNFHELTPTNNRMTLMKQEGGLIQGGPFNGFPETAYSLNINGNRELVLQLDIDPQNTETFDLVTPFVAETDRWYHFAFSFDDATLKATIYVDGVAIASGVSTSSLLFDPAKNSQIGEAGRFDTQATIDNYRIWNVARTEAEVQEGMSRQYDDNEQLVLDYRFKDNNTITVLDHSSSENTGFLSPVNTRPILVPGLADVGTHSFTIGVEDGRGGMTTQTFDVEIVPEQRGDIAGHLFDDKNGNGTQDDPDEASLEGWQVYVDTNNNSFADPGELQAITDAAGNYRFDGLLPENYPIRVSPVAGFATPSIGDVAVTANQITTVETAASALALSHIRGSLLTEDDSRIGYWKVYADLNGNDVRDENEPTAISDRNGDYALTGLGAGTFTIRTERPAGWAEVNNGDGLSVTLGTDQVSTGNDFVLKALNTSVTGGVRFVTTAPTTITARNVFRYASVAVAIGETAISYDISLAPDGMSIDPKTGRVAWKPTIDQVGEHLVILRAKDSSGSISLHDFTISVTAPNTAPVISNVAPTAAFVGLTYAFDIAAQDAENGVLTFAIISGPSVATLDAATGKVRWTPVAADVGTADFTVAVRDALGQQTTMNFTVNVSADQPAATPFEIQSPRSSVGLGQDYVARASGVDALGRPLTWSLTTGPTDFTVSANGTLSWQPGNADLGQRTVTMLATNADGETESFEYTLSVVGRPVISAPIINSYPVLSTVIGSQYAYDIVVNDENGDPVSFSLIEAPVGMSIHPSHGTIRWTPESDQVGEADVLIEVTDPDGASTTQSFKLKVSRAGGPPIITSTPPTEVSVGGSFLYSVAARDAEGDPLTYRLLTAPAGAIINETTGEISWTPTAGQIGQQAIVIEVSDGIGGAATQGFAVLVGDGIVNLAPEITSAAPRFTAVGADYEYQISATDPESTTITFTVGRGPVGLTVDANGLVTWTPAATQTGQFVVTLVATDAGGASAIESFELDVLAANRVPVINSTAPSQMFAGEQFRYDLLVSDADSDPLKFELLNGPTGSSIDPFGRVRWATNNNLIGPHNFSIKVTDPRGGEATQSFTLDVVADTQAPTLLLTDLNDEKGRNILPWQGPIRIFARVSDNVGVASLTLTANGVDLAVDASGVASLAFDDYLFSAINVEAIATDVNGNVTTKSIVVDFDFPEGWSGAAAEDIPTAIISSPDNGGAAVGIVSVVGTATHENFSAFQLSYRTQEETSFTNILRSESAVENGVLGEWDTTLLPTGRYVLRLEVVTTAAIANVVEHQVDIAGGLKLGDFSISQTDLVVQFEDINIPLTRSYSTLDASRESSDVGFGWKIDYRDVGFSVSIAESGLEELGIYTPFAIGTRVYVNLPEVGRVGFTFKPEIVTLPGLGDDLSLATPKFEADPGVNATLKSGGGRLFINAMGQLSAGGSTPWNPLSPDFGGGLTIHLDNGTEYRINGEDGKLSSITNRNGSKLTLGDTGIFDDQGTSITFERDANGRIASVIGQGSQRVDYRYDPSGNLTEVIDELGNTISYEYSSTQAHYLESIVDPLGRPSLRIEYDDQGRISSIIDALGNKTELTIDASARLETITDANGGTTVFAFDERGNLVSTIDQTGNQTSFEFDDRNNQTKITDALGNETQFSYDVGGRVTGTIDSLGFATHRTYNRFGQAVGDVNELGDTNSVSYESNGAISKIETADGSEYIPTTDANGELIGFEGGLEFGNAVYDSQGRVVHQAASDNNYEQETEYNAEGQISKTTVIVEGERFETTLEYDLAGRLIATKRFDGFEQTFVVDAAGQLIEVTDSLGNVKKRRFDAVGRLVEIISPDSTPHDETDNPVVRFEYDSIGNQTAIIDALGLRTEFVYDDASRLISVIYADATPDDPSDNPRVRVEYDAAGRVVAEIDELGRRREFEYNANGNQTLIRDRLGNETQFVFDATGNLVTVIDALGRETTNIYDKAGRQTATILSDGTTRSLDGNLTSRGFVSTDPLGNKESIEMDASGRILSMIDTAGGQVSNQYDPLGNLISQTNALGFETIYRYDILGRSTGLELALGQQSSLQYDTRGLVASETDFNGQQSTFTYNPLGQLIQTQYEDGSSVLAEYGLSGLLNSVTDENGTTQLEYDLRNRLTKRTDAFGQTIEYSYDAVGNVASISTPSREIGYGYDAESQLTSVSENGVLVVSYRYNAIGKQIETIFASGASQSRDYNATNQLTSITDRFSDSDTQSTIYSYDGNGNVSNAAFSNGDSQSFEYDSLNRLTKETAVFGGTTTVTEYTYDAGGNRQTKVVDGEVTNYSYNENGQLIQSVSAEGTRTYLYDDNGNLLAENLNGVPTTHYVWNQRGRLIGIDSDGDSINEISNRYDYDGNLIEESTSTGTKRFLVDVNRKYSQILEELEAGVPTTANTYGLGLVSQTDSGGQKFIHRDRLGSTIFSSDSSGLELTHYRYDAFGNLIGNPEMDTNVLFTGERYNPESGLYFLRDRFLSPTIGRFISQDRFDGISTISQSLNRYTYVRNNPVNLTDPSGLTSLSEQLSVAQVKGLLTKATSAFKAYQAVDKSANSVSAAIVLTGAALQSTIFSVMVYWGDSRFFETDFTIIDIEAPIKAFADYVESVSVVAAPDKGDFLAGSVKLGVGFPDFDLTAEFGVQPFDVKSGQASFSGDPFFEFPDASAGEELRGSLASFTLDATFTVNANVLQGNLGRIFGVQISAEILSVFNYEVKLFPQIIDALRGIPNPG